MPRRGGIRSGGSGQDELTGCVTIVDCPTYQIPQHRLSLPLVEQPRCGSMQDALRFGVEEEIDSWIDVDAYDAGCGLLGRRCLAAPFRPFDEYGSASAQSCL